MFKSEKVTSTLNLRDQLFAAKIKMGDLFYFADGLEKDMGKGIFKYLHGDASNAYWAQTDVVETTIGTGLGSFTTGVVTKFDKENIPVSLYRAIFRNNKNEVVLSQRLFETKDKAKVVYGDKFLQLDNTPVSVSKKFLKIA